MRLKQNKRIIKTAVIQLASNDSKDRNIACAVRLVTKAIADGAEFIALPETFNYRGDLRDLVSIVEDVPGKSLLPLLAMAKKHKVWILAGSIYEKAKDPKKFYNTSVLIDNFGNITAKYRKIHRFDILLKGKEISESKFCLAGQKGVVAQMSGIKAGLSICYDLRFPELYRNYSEKGVRIICVAASFTKPTGQAHWEVLIRARAIENQCFVIAPNQFGLGFGSVRTYGNSMIVDPWGRVLARASKNKEEVIYAELDFDELDNLRKNFPVLKHKRLGV